MIRVALFVLPLLLSVPLVVGPAAEAEDDGGFVSLFNGANLDGWETPDPTYWSIEDGAITAKITAEHPCSVNQYLVYAKEPLGDFELKLSFRMNGWPTAEQPNVNGGFQFRSTVIEGHDVAGYQVDNNLATDWLVRLYDEHGRHTLAWRGENTTITDKGELVVAPIEAAKGPADFKLEEWHEYHLICQGPKITLKVNGKVMAEVTDQDPKQQEFTGVLALQLHSGPPMTVQFRDVRVKKL
jgi:hypothetical protein